MNALTPLQQQILDVLGNPEALGMPFTRAQLDRNLSLAKSPLEISVALDGLQIHDRIVRVERGSSIYYVFKGEPLLAPKPAVAIVPLEPLEPPAPKAQPPVRVTGKPLRPRGETRAQMLSILQRAPHSSAQLRERLGIAKSPFYRLLQGLIEAGLVQKTSLGYQATPESRQAGATLAAQAQVADNGASEGAAPVGELPSETSPTGPREGLSDSATSDFSTSREAKKPEVSKAAPITEFQRCAQAERGVLNAPFEIPPKAEPLHMEMNVPITEAIYALRSDGQLLIEIKGATLVFARGTTRQLIDYLDRVCAIDTH